MDSTERYMKRALELAEMGWGCTNPNPLVGAVIVKDGVIISEGFHEALGSDHAEAAAIKRAGVSAAGGAMFVNLEPCSHYGRTPPCASAIIDAGIKEVTVSMVDPNPLVSGRGVKMLRDAGIKVVTGVLEEEAVSLNEIFIKHITENRPFVIAKTAMTLDGKIATVTGDSKWISGESSRIHVHRLRERVAAIMVGINTVMKDDPMLTARLGMGRNKNPLRIIVDSRGVIPEDGGIMNSISQAGVLLATTEKLDRRKETRLENKGVKVVKVDGADGRVDLGHLMDRLNEMQIDSVLIEGGGTLISSALKERIVDKYMVFVAPFIIGGKDAPTPVEGPGIEYIRDGLRLGRINMSRFGEDTLIEGYMRMAKKICKDNNSISSD